MDNTAVKQKYLFCRQKTMICPHLRLHLRSKGDSKARLRNLIFSVSLSRMRGKRRPRRAGVKLPHRCVGWRKTRGKVEKGKRETKSSTSGFVALRWWKSRLENRWEGKVGEKKIKEGIHRYFYPDFVFKRTWPFINLSEKLSKNI